MSELNPKQERFCLEYIKDLNATQAAIRAGYAEGSAKVQASRLLTNDNAVKYIEELKAKRSRAVGIDAQWVLREAAASYHTCIENGAYGPAKGFLELVGKHVDISAFEDRVKHSGEVTHKYSVETGIPLPPAEFDDESVNKRLSH